MARFDYRSFHPHGRCLSGANVANTRTAPAAVLERVARIDAVCERHGVPLPAAALQFPLAHATSPSWSRTSPIAACPSRRRCGATSRQRVLSLRMRHCRTGRRPERKRPPKTIRAAFGQISRRPLQCRVDRLRHRLRDGQLRPFEILRHTLRTAHAEHLSLDQGSAERKLDGRCLKRDSEIRTNRRGRGTAPAT